MIIYIYIYTFTWSPGIYYKDRAVTTVCKSTSTYKKYLQEARNGLTEMLINEKSVNNTFYKIGTLHHNISCPATNTELNWFFRRKNHQWSKQHSLSISDFYSFVGIIAIPIHDAQQYTIPFLPKTRTIAAGGLRTSNFLLNDIRM